ncbi:hypothetical protein M8J76_014733 [Diaphorina citri]|nr:hypothetical protein M8J76_014733 [Diaphorina citri]
MSFSACGFADGYLICVLEYLKFWCIPMESFTDLPESLASMTLVNNFNADFLANKDTIKSRLNNNVNILNGFKSFHENTSDTVDNKIHQVLHTTTHHEHKLITDTDTTNNTTKLEDNNNNTIDSDLDEITTDTDDSDSSLLTDESFQSDEEKGIEMIRSAVKPDSSAKQVKKIITKIENLHNVKPKSANNLNNEIIDSNVVNVKVQAKKINESNKIKKRSRLLQTGLAKKNKKETRLPTFDKISDNIQPMIRNMIDKKLEVADLQNGTEEINVVREELVKSNVQDVLEKKINDMEIEDKKSFHLIQRRREQNSDSVTGDICQSCDKSPPSDGLLSYSDMPPHLQFNPYITSGYRPILNAWGCLRSLCYVHNETVNIFTHGIPIFYILMTIPKTMPWHLEDTRSQFLIWSHLAGAICPWLGSILYHLFMNCGSSPLVYKRLLQIDMFGIWISQSFGALPMVFASVHCFSYNIRVIVIASYCLFSIWGLHKALIARTPWSRRICFALPFMMRNLLCLLRLTKYGGGAPDSLIPTILQDVMCVIGGVIGAEKVPERWWPGHTDLCFNSHNLMHVLALLALYYNNRSSVRDIQWMRKTRVG